MRQIRSTVYLTDPHKQPVTHYLDPASGLNVIAERAGTFISGWKLNPAQLWNVSRHGGL